MFLQRCRAVQLIADRFIVSDDSHALDLASGRRVLLRMSTAGGASEQLRWAAKCSQLLPLRHAHVARLADYGRVGEVRRFEAWECDGPWAGPAAARTNATEHATAFLRGCGWAVDAAGESAVYAAEGRPVLVPGDCVRHGDAACALESESAIDLACCGWAAPAGSEIAAVEEELGVMAAAPRLLSAWTADPLRADAFRSDIARAARLAGLIPVRVDLPRGPWEALIADRSLLLIADTATTTWSTILQWMLQSPRAHVVLMIGNRDVRGARAIALPPLSEEALPACVRPSRMSAPVRARVTAAARRASGSIQVFVNLLWGSGVRSADVAIEKGARVAESMVQYGQAEARADAGESRLAPRTWPAPGELVALCGKMEAAVARIESGRWASGDRALRQTIGSLARRGDWTRAARGAVALAEALVRRGRSRDALELVDASREYAAKAGQADAILTTRAAVIGGRAWVDLAQLDKAGALLRMTTTPGGDGEWATQARVALARCLFWQGAFDEAHTESDAAASTQGDARIAALTLRARAAVGLGEVSSALRTSAEAVDAAHAAGSHAALAGAMYTSAFIRLTVGDLDACDRDAARCVRAARIAHEPLVAIKARLLEAESARRRGRAQAPASFLQRLKRCSGSSLPPIVRARVDLVADLLAGPPELAVKRRVAATGLQALSLFAPGALRDRRSPPALTDALDILRCSQNARDELAVLRDICGLLKGRLGAAAVALFSCDAAGDDSRLGMVAADGRIDSEIARRVASLRDPIPPHTVGERQEAGAPVPYGGELIGVMVCRWTFAARVDRERSVAALSVAAAAAAPALAAVVARQREGAAAGEIVGASPLIDEVRRALERAAAAPFPVLISGESGSGKELVARAIHRRGPRRARTFCTVNCAALPDDLVETELFGHARGAFTGAVAERAGVFEDAHGGTLFLDEVGELSPRAQAKLLRAIQEGEIRRVGENMLRRVDVRIVAATNRELRREVAAGRFRLDLLYRLDVIHIELPPLRERRADIPVLAACCWREAAERIGSRATLGAATVAALARYDWPGNVRELQNVLAALAVRSARRGIIAPEALPPAFHAGAPEPSSRLDEARRTFEEQFVRAALVRTGGHRTRAAAELGLSRQGLTKLLSRLGISES